MIEKCEYKLLFVVYFDQFLGAAYTQKLVKTLFSAAFQPFLFILKLFQRFHAWNQQKTSEKTQENYFFLFLLTPLINLIIKIWRKLTLRKKCFDQLLGARSTQKLVEIHNSCLPHNSLYKFTFVLRTGKRIPSPLTIRYFLLASLISRLAPLWQT